MPERLLSLMLEPRFGNFDFGGFLLLEFDPPFEMIFLAI
jgi:hypothetical protein